MSDWFDNWWRKNCVKHQFIKRLHKRAGYPYLISFDPPFWFETENNKWQSLVQLESVVEFFLNYRGPEPQLLPGDPWLQDARPLKPNDDGYFSIDLRQPKGSAAEIVAGGNGLTVKLNGEPNLRLVLPNPQNNPQEPGFHSNAAQGYPAPQRYLYDTLWLEEDTHRPNRLYRIMAVNADDFTVTLDEAPQFDGKSAWRINTRPHLVMIDGLGPRERTNQGISTELKGQNATPAVDGNGDVLLDPNGNAVLALDGPPDLSRINDRFDTIYLSSDTEDNRGFPRRAYRIIGHDDNAHTVTVEGNPLLDNDLSEWSIPAGVGGFRTQIPQLDHNLRGYTGNATPIRRQRGFDHYDGVIFVVHRDYVIANFRWTSFTSRDWGSWRQDNFWPQSLSSLRGNKPYFYHSYRSGRSFLNYSFAIVDIEIENTDGIDYDRNDHIQEARYYFGTPQYGVQPLPDALEDRVTADNPPNPPPHGKTLVRLHRGNQNAIGSNSAGCLVSPVYVDMRTALLATYLNDYEDFHGPGSVDLHVTRVWQANTNAASEALYNAQNTVTLDQFQKKAAGIFWMIRPDELPES
jgi:hypothetical protein